MRRIVALLFLAAAGLPVLADDILYFKNGTTMPVRGHRVEGTTLHVDLDGGGSIEFPIANIERIERAGKDVFLDAGAKSRANRVFDGGHTVTGDYSVQGRAPVRHTRGEWQGTEPDAEAPKIETDDNGMAVHRPFRGQGAGRGKLSHTGSREVLSSPLVTSKGQGIVGTSRIGSRNTIGNATPPGARSERPQLVGLNQRDAPPTEPPAESEDGATTEPPADSGEESGEE